MLTLVGIPRPSSINKKAQNANSYLVELCHATELQVPAERAPLLVRLQDVTSSMKLGDERQRMQTAAALLMAKKSCQGCGTWLADTSFPKPTYGTKGTD